MTITKWRPGTIQEYEGYSIKYERIVAHKEELIVFRYEVNNHKLDLSCYPPYNSQYIVACIDIFTSSYEKYHNCNSFEEAEKHVEYILKRANSLMVFS